MTDEVAPVDPKASGAPSPPRASVRWGGYIVLMALLLGGGLLLSWRPLRPSAIPEWLWWFFTGAYGVGFFATAVVLASGMVQDAADLMLERGWRVLARATILLMIVALAGLAVWAFRHGHYVTAVVAALLATVGPLARRGFPRLPRAQARYRT